MAKRSNLTTTELILKGYRAEEITLAGFKFKFFKKKKICGGKYETKIYKTINGLCAIFEGGSCHMLPIVFGVSEMLDEITVATLFGWLSGLRYRSSVDKFAKYLGATIEWKDNEFIMNLKGRRVSYFVDDARRSLLINKIYQEVWL